jgi:hypothetical protein
MSNEQTSQETVEKKETTTITEENITLDDVYRDAGLDKIETQPSPQPQPQPAPQIGEPSKIPDPYDSENFKAYMARKDSETTALRSTLGNVAQFLTTMQAQESKKALESDIKSAVEHVNETVGHPKPKVIEALLDAEARENPKFKAIWDNRHKNPVALDNALKIVAKKFGDELSVKVDPALVAAQRARKLSQQQMATTSAESEQSPQEERLAAAKGSDFDAEWGRLLSGGN